MLQTDSEKSFYKNMEASLKLKVQGAARTLRKQQQKLYNMLNKLEESSSAFDFFDNGNTDNNNTYDEENPECMEWSMEQVNDTQ